MRSIEAGSQTNFEAAEAATQPIEQVKTPFSEPAFLADAPQAVIAPTYPKLLRKPLIAAGGIAAAILTACGGGGDDASVALSTVEPVATVGQTVIVVEPTPRNTPDARTVIPTPTQETPVAQGPTEADKARVRDQADEMLILLSQEIKALKTPFSPTMSPDGFKAQQTDVERLVADINQSLEKNDIAAAQTSLLQLKERIKQIGDGSKRAIIPEDERKKHDPTGKYLKPFDNPDPATKEWFLDTIDILVALDGQPSTPSGTPPVVK